MPLGEAPGTVVDIEPDVDVGRSAPAVDAHSMSPAVVLGLAAPASGGHVPRVVVVGCQPLTTRRGYRPVGTGAGSGRSGRVDTVLAKSCRTFIPLHRRSCNRDPQARRTQRCSRLSPRSSRSPCPTSPATSKCVRCRQPVTRYRILPTRSRVWIDARSNLHPIHTEAGGLEGWLELRSTTAGSTSTRPCSGTSSSR